MKDIGVAVSTAVLFLIWKGFVFNTADQAEPLILVYEKLNPALYPQDFYVNAAKDIFTVRTYYIEFVSFLGKYFSLYQVSLVLTFLCLFASVTGFIKIARLLTHHQLTGYLAPFFILFVFYGWTVGGNAVQYNLLISSTLAKALSVWGIYFLLKKRWIYSGALIGIGGLFQVLVGLQLAVILVLLLLLYRQWKGVLQWSVAFLVTILPMLGPVVYRQFMLEGGAVDMELYYRLLYIFRNPHHYLPSLFPLTAYIKCALLLVAGSICGIWFLQRDRFYKIFSFCSIIILGLVGYSVLLEVLNVNFIGKLQWFKTTIWLEAAGAMLVAVAAEYLLRMFHLKKYVLLISVFLPVVWIVQAHIRYDTPLSLDHRSAAQKDLAAIHEWIRINASNNWLFATYATDESFLCEAQRSVSVAWTPMVHEPWFMEAWYRRFHQQYGVSLESSDYKAMLSEADHYYETGQWLGTVKVDAVLLRKDAVFPQQGKVLHESSFYKVVALNL